MDRAAVVERTQEHVRRMLHGDTSGHDWWHIERVRQMALRLGEQEGADPFVVELAALLHDIADWKFYQGDSEAGPRVATAWLEECGVDNAVIEHVCAIIREISFKGSGVPTPMASIEGDVVQDADRLDALGAIGIARAFAYGGHQGHEIHNPDVESESHETFDAYRASAGPTINHFHEKLLLLAERMNTEAARRLAKGRHEFVETFLARFDREWSGDS
jgi:uncharacterized protein